MRIKEFKKHLNQMTRVHRAISQYLQCGYGAVVEFYAMNMIALFITQRLFDCYEVDIYIPKLEPLTEVEDICDVGCRLTEGLSLINYSSFRKLGWQYNEVTDVTCEIEQIHIDRCIKDIADCGEKEFQLIRDIVTRFENAYDHLDYFGILFYPHMDDMGSWLEREGHKDLLAIYNISRQRINDLLVNCFIGYELFSVNGTIYIPIVLGESEADFFYSIDFTYIDVCVFFDLYVLHRIYELAVGRGFNDKGKMAGVSAGISDNREQLRISYEKWRQE